MADASRLARWAGIVLTVALAAIVAVRSDGRPSGRRSPVLAVPPDAFLVATVDVPKLARSPLFAAIEPLLTRFTTPVHDICGLVPEAHVTTLALAVPPEKERSDFGVAVATDLDAGALSSCIQRVLRARGVRPSVTKRGRFERIHDGSPLGLAAIPTFAVAGGEIVVGRGGWLLAMEEASSVRPSANPHVELRRALPPGLAVAVTALLPRPLRERLKHEMASSPNVAMGAILAIDSVSLGLSLGEAGEAALVAEAHCETSEACADVAAFLNRRKGELSGDLRLRLLGLAELLRSTEIGAESTRVHLRARMPADQAAELLRRLVPGARQPTPASSTQPPSAGTVPVPEEFLPAKRDGGVTPSEAVLR